uniref:Disulfide bond formation protein B n=1 Tax=OCS116 cluster bacterium TaxID=2030921 RepID=A0A2A4YSY5_9PROT
MDKNGIYMTFTYRNGLWLILLLALTAIGTALFYEYVLNYQPCALCYEERLPYYALIAIAIFALATDKFIGKALMIGLGILMFLGGLYGAYHAGIEWGFWPGPVSCTGTGLNISADVDLLALVQDVKIVPCDVANWRLFGISFAGYNTLVSLLIADICAFTLLKNRAIKN